MICLYFSSEILHDNTPFSCCDPHANRPCINVDILETGRYTEYTLDSLTIYEDGCLDSVMDFFGNKVLVNIGVAAFIIFGGKVS